MQEKLFYYPTYALKIKNFFPTNDCSNYENKSCENHNLKEKTGKNKLLIKKDNRNKKKTN